MPLPAWRRSSSRTRRFPRTSSLRVGGRQELVPVAEFQGKIAAAKSAGGALVIARTEALIAGCGQDEALRRGAAYAEAGADAVLIHSKARTPDEIVAFCRAWPGRVPLVLVPTSYSQLSFTEIAALSKVGLIICGNHAIRAVVAAMQNVFHRILAEGGIAGVESEIASVADVFALQGDKRMRDIEKAYCAKERAPLNRSTKSRSSRSDRSAFPSASRRTRRNGRRRPACGGA